MKPVILNLGCGTTTHPDLVNIDWSFYMRLKKSKLLTALAYPLLSNTRRHRLRELPDDVVAHDLRKGIPFPDNSVDAVYHSHMFEHIDRDVAPLFLKEIYRVLKPGGIHRICVPDLETEVRRYLASLEECKEGRGLEGHDGFVAAIIEQTARREATGTLEQAPWIRPIERVLLGDARSRGETHQWMYDFYNLSTLLRQAGFQDVTRKSFSESNIPGWAEFRLELDAAGEERKPRSLYCESIK